MAAITAMSTAFCGISHVSELSESDTLLAFLLLSLLTADIKPGMGLYRTEFANGTSKYYARNCDSNSYGVPAISYGFTLFACRECPDNLVASTDKVNYPNSASYFVDNGDGAKGFIDTRACVTKAGYGYDSRRSNPCRAGTYNDKDNYDICKSCPYGTSTAGAGLGVTVADCKVAPGFGFHTGQLQKCPLGELLNILPVCTGRSTCSLCAHATVQQSAHILRSGADYKSRTVGHCQQSTAAAT